MLMLLLSNTHMYVYFIFTKRCRMKPYAILVYVRPANSCVRVGQFQCLDLPVCLEGVSWRP